MFDHARLPHRPASPPQNKIPVRATVLFGLILTAALSRLIPHPPNFTPIGAIGLFGGAYFASRWAAMTLPLVAMFLSDLVLGMVFGWGFSSMTLVIYACLTSSVLFGRCISSPPNVGMVARQSVASALLFFFVVNFFYWATGHLYPKTLGGLGSCYVAALPFLGNMLAGFAFWGCVLFGGFEFLKRRMTSLSQTSVRL